jgi:hypothetical protein
MIRSDAFREALRQHQITVIGWRALDRLTPGFSAMNH